MAQKTLYPVYITSGSDFEGILSNTGKGEAHQLMYAWVDFEKHIGTIAFDNKLQSLSKACILHSFEVRFRMMNNNAVATSGVYFNLSPRIIDSYYTNGNNIAINSMYQAGSNEDAFNADDSYIGIQRTLINKASIYDFIGDSNKLLGVYLWVTRPTAYWQTKAYMKELYAVVDYTPRYYAKFYNDDGTLLNEQMVNGNSSPVKPIASERPGYDFAGWKASNGTLYTDTLPSSVETDLAFTAVYNKRPIISASVKAGLGTISPEGDIEMPYGSSQTFKIHTQWLAYEIRNVYVDGEPVGSCEEYTFENVTSDHTIEAEFVMSPWLRFEPYENGKVYRGDAEKKILVNKDGEGIKHYHSRFVYAEPNIGYELESFKLKDENKENGTYIETDIYSGYKIPSVDYHEYTITANFRKIVYNVIKSASAGGTIVGPDSAEYGDNISYAIIPNDHYIITDILFDGTSVLSQVVFDGNNATYSLENITDNHSLSATFKRVVYVDLDIGANGSIQGETVVDYNTGQEYIITADEGYSIDKIYLNDTLYYQVTAVEKSRTVYLPNIITDNKLKATFTNNIASLTVQQPAEGGYISGNAEGSYVCGTELNFFALANTGWHLGSWNNGKTDTQISFKITEDTALTATFKKYNHTTITKNDGNGIVDPETISADYGDKVTFTAIPDSGYVFSHWEDGSTNAVREYNVTGNAELTAVFVKDYYSVIGEGVGGTVIATGNREKEGKFEYESIVTLTAIPNEGFYFVHWEADVSATAEIKVEVPAQDIVYKAVFKQYEYKVDTNSTIGGKVTESSVIKHGEDFEIIIESDIGYKFIDMLVDGESIFKNVTVTLDGGRYILPNVRKEHSVEVVFGERRYSGRKKLIDYYPPVIQKILEFIELTDAQQPMVSRVWDAVAFAYDNQFIDEATEEGVIGWEKDYGMVPTKTDTLKERKQRLKAMWVPNSKYTYQWLVNWLKTVTGDENIQLPEIKNYSIKTYLPGNSNYSEIIEIMKRYIPANMCIDPILKLKSSEQNLYTGAAFRMKIKEQLIVGKEEVNDET